MPQPNLPKTTDDALRDGEGWLFRQEMVDCGRGDTGRCRKCTHSAGHGPYWYRYRWYDGKMHKRYVGRRLPEGLTASDDVKQDTAPSTGVGAD